MSDMNDRIYDAMCAGCPKEKWCHDNAEVCDDVLALEMKEEELDDGEEVDAMR